MRRRTTTLSSVKTQPIIPKMPKILTQSGNFLYGRCFAKPYPAVTIRNTPAGIARAAYIHLAFIGLKTVIMLVPQSTCARYKSLEERVIPV